MKGWMRRLRGAIGLGLAWAAAWFSAGMVLLLIVGFVVTMVGQAFLHPKGGGRPPQGGQTTRPPERIGGTLVQDPQCGTYLPRERAIAVTSGGSTQYFCSDTCRDEWKTTAAASRQ